MSRQRGGSGTHGPPTEAPRRVSPTAPRSRDPKAKRATKGTPGTPEHDRSAALLGDGSSPRRKGSASGRGARPRPPSDRFGAMDWLLLSGLWPVLARERGARSRTLASVNLTTRDGCGVREIAPAFAAWIAETSGAALLSLERSDDGMDHLHGLVLAHDLAAIPVEWCKRADALPDVQRLTILWGWPQHVRGMEGPQLHKDVSRVLRYAFKPWPAQFGARSAGDVFCSGAFVGAWRAALEAALKAGCARCGRAMPQKKRGALTCSERCRKAYYRARIAGTSPAPKRSPFGPPAGAPGGPLPAPEPSAAPAPPDPPPPSLSDAPELRAAGDAGEPEAGPVVPPSTSTPLAPSSLAESPPAVPDPAELATLLFERDAQRAALRFEIDALRSAWKDEDTDPAKIPVIVARLGEVRAALAALDAGEDLPP
jgi:hypothetical protein